MKKLIIAATLFLSTEAALAQTDISFCDDIISGGGGGAVLI